MGLMFSLSVHSGTLTTAAFVTCGPSLINLVYQAVHRTKRPVFFLGNLTVSVLVPYLFQLFVFLSSSDDILFVY